ncbi:MAG: membrane protein insertase YidC, partial [Terriglobia bacterium]
VTAPATEPPAIEPVRVREPQAAPPPGTAAVKQGIEERLLTVETETATLVFSSRGAVVESWRLKSYGDGNGEPLELVRGGVTGLGYPLSFELIDDEQERTLNNALYTMTPSAGPVRAPAQLLFEWSDGRLAARKRFRVTREGLVEIKTEVREDGQLLEHALAWRGGFGAPTRSSFAQRSAQATVFVRGPQKLLRQPAVQAGQQTGWIFKSDSPFPYTGEASYAGLDDRYFAAVFFPERPEMSVHARTQAWTPEGEERPQTVGLLWVSAPAGVPVQLFVGPKALDVLEHIEPAPFANGTRAQPEDELVDFGWFWWIAKPLFWAMRWLYDNGIANYGWVIVLLTILINAAMFPLRWKSMQSSYKMQRIAPQVRAIQTRYKQYKFNDPRKQQMQQEIMGLYKQHGVNPIGGCLPMLLQMPFFFGFYTMLLIAIELRQAPWILWIQDLSEPDPYFILPILVTASMFLSMRMTPMSAPDPNQKRMQYIMVGVFAYLFFVVSAGLVLYWFVSNLLSVGQQWWINKRQRMREAAEKAAARGRKKKKHKRELEAEAGS